MAEMYSVEGMLDMYLFENRQLLERLQEIVLGKKEDEGFDEDGINEVFRIMHTIKSSSTVMMFDEIMAISHKLEDVFFYIRESRPAKVPNQELTSYALKVRDFIVDEMDKLENGEAADGASKDLCDGMDQLLEQMKKENGNLDSQSQEPKEASMPKQFYIAPKAVAKDGAGRHLIDLDSSVDEIEERMRRRQNVDGSFEEMLPGNFVIQPKNSDRIHNLLKKTDIPGKPSFISVDSSKMDKLEELVKKLLDTETEVFQSKEVSIPESLQDFFRRSGKELSDISAQLQSLVRSMHMVPLTNTFQKMHRVVFDISKKLDKDIAFEMAGERTEVDKNILSHISAPLMHLVRNAADHGIESREERIAAGKTEQGKITLSARTSDGYISICVTDNGNGLNREKILRTARSRGLVDESIPDSAYTDAQVYQFITMPGFSTKKKVTEFSGRGVGMDVVVQDLMPIGGKLEIASTQGKGSEMTIQIPLRNLQLS